MKKQRLKSDEIINGFKLAQNTKEDVILEVAIDKTPWSVATHPYLSSKYAYIHVTKGEDKMITIINNDGTTEKFYCCHVPDDKEELRRVIDDTITLYGIPSGLKSIEIPNKITIIPSQQSYFKVQVKLSVPDIPDKVDSYYFVGEKDTEEEIIERLEDMYKVKYIFSSTDSQSGKSEWIIDDSIDYPEEEVVLNTLDDFSSGFKIQRNGEIITLSQEEMRDFRYFDNALDGQVVLEEYRDIASPKELAIIDKIQNNPKECYDLYQDVAEAIEEQVPEVMSVVKRFLSLFVL